MAGRRILFHLLAFLRIGFLTDTAAFCPEGVVFAVKHHVFAQRAFQSPVEDGYFDGWLETYCLEMLVAISENPGMPAGKRAFQGGSDGAVKIFDIVRAQTFSIRRIHDDHTLLLIFGPLSEVFAFNRYIVAEAGIVDVAAGDRHCFRVDIASENSVRRCLFCRVVVVDCFKELAVEIGPLLECKAVTVYSRIDIGGNQSRFYEEGA